MTDWVDPKADIDAYEQRKDFRLCPESNHYSPVFQQVPSALYGLSYLSCWKGKVVAYFAVLSSDFPESTKEKQ
jgi:hypothetical protein